MTVPTATQQTYSSIGRREDLSDIIYNISPTETPFMATVGRGTASQTLHEWQTDILAAAAENAEIEGDDPANDALAYTTREANYTQISTKVIQVSGTHEAVDKAGRKSELAYQIAKRGKELKRDIEFICTRDIAAAAGNATTARHVGALECWFDDTNDFGTAGANGNRGTLGSEGGSSGGGTVATPTDGTLRAPTEAVFQGVIANVWTSGGDPTFIMCGPFNKGVISGYSGGATKFDRTEDKRLVAAIDVYVSDFGEHRIVPNRFQRDVTIFILTPRLWSIDYLRSFRQHPLAKTGDSERRQLIVEWTLRASQQTGSAVIADCLIT